MTLVKVNLKHIIIHKSMSFMYAVRGELANTLVLSAIMVRHVVMLKVIRPGTFIDGKWRTKSCCLFNFHTHLIHWDEE